MTEMKINLDQKAAHYAQQMVINAKCIKVKNPVKTLENLVTKTLGVLQEQGIYAMMLFLFSRTSDEREIAPVIRMQLFRLLKDNEQDHQIPAFADKNVPVDEADAQKVLEFYSDQVLDNLDLTFLIRDLYEQTLIYARYGAKAEKESDSKSEEESMVEM